jgi:hypothetical protein
LLSEAPPDWPEETVTDVLRIEGALFLSLCAALVGLRLRSRSVQLGPPRNGELQYLRAHTSFADLLVNDVLAKPHRSFDGATQRHAAAAHRHRTHRAGSCQRDGGSAL